MSVRNENQGAPQYVLGHSKRELERLTTQARLVDPITRHFFLQAGISPGMRVLDIGSGAGDVAFLTAGLVGATGEVVGVDRAPDALATARARAESLSLSQVSFQQGDPTEMTFARPFDAVTGRYVLMFQPNPSEMVRKLVAHLRPGGVVVFHEPDWAGVASSPPVPTYDRCCQWLVETLRWHGHEAHMGMKLHSTFIAAGLSAPTMGVGALVGGGEKSIDGLRLLADLTRTMLPAIERAGVATAAEVGLQSLEDRMVQEATRSESVILGRLEIGAWSRVALST